MLFRKVNKQPGRCASAQLSDNLPAALGISLIEVLVVALQFPAGPSSRNSLRLARFCEALGTAFWDPPCRMSSTDPAAPHG